jgi:sortase A
MRRAIRITGTLLIVAGVLTLAWAVLVWMWQDPFTAAYTKWKQHELGSQYNKRAAAFKADGLAGLPLGKERKSLALAAQRYRTATDRGEAIGRIHIPRMGINMVLVDGTDHETLKKGPGRDLRSYMPGQNRLVYIAGHRTTYLAPFSHIDDLRKGDRVTIDVPYGSFVYSVTGSRVVKATDLSVLKSPKHELLELQACHPRFFATHRYIAYARLVHVDPRGGTPFDLEAAGAQTNRK